MRRTLKERRAIITGASSGIGRELARRLAQEGCHLVLVARREDRLRRLFDELGPMGRKVEVVPGDITDAQIRQRTVEIASTALGGLDILVNNAGVGALGLFEHATPERLRRIMEVNFFAPVELIRSALPSLKQGFQPIIVNISSILGHRGVPHNSEYCASKFALHGFSEALRAELVRYGIDVLVVSPGTTETEFFNRVLERTTAPNWPQHQAVSAAEVARQIVRAMRLGRHEIIPYRWGRVLCRLNRLSPRLVDWLVARYV